MSRKIVLIAAVSLVPAYVAASWGLGRATHARFDSYAQQLNKQPMALFKITERNYTPGVFSSEERVTLELNQELFGKLSQRKAAQSKQIALEGQEGPVENAAEQSATGETKQPLRFTIVNKIQHGPLPGFRSFGLARVESSLVLSEETRAKVAEVIGDQEPVLVTSVHGFTGAGSSTVTSPAFDIDKDGAKLSWKGFDGAFSYGRNLSSLECALKAPGLDLTDKDGAHTQMGELSLDCDLTRAFDDVYLGTAALTLASLHYSTPGGEKPAKFEQLTYAADSRKDGDYIDMALKLGVGNMALKDIVMSNVGYDIAINHVHGPTLGAMQRKLKDPATTSALGDPVAGQAVVMGVFGEFLPQLLEHSPQLVIERIGFSMPEGEAGLKATLQLNDFKKEDVAGAPPMALLGKLDVSADIWFSEGLLMRDWSSERASNEDAQAANRLAMMRMQITQLEQQGYIQRQKDRLQSHLEFKNGALSANGKPIGPPGMR